ncbi:MAG: tRNA (adenosine(37)-N6)-threonylcarbamoyltransferase complex ATPase subunit type 1 TsaE [Candidatus Colwellbacteria bacterium]|nr:tRNA (adenosine(37)-N6)-threonylcarbamoyltransferase complex ATPase subunit type 1 TsaE [Candidatus Colwellbacteria bacterium]
MKYFSRSPSQTQKIAKVFAKEVLKTAPQKPAVLALTGELGAGKTTFVRGFMREAGVKNKILSPTFVIFKSFDLRKGRGFQKIYHIDTYRVQARDLVSLGFKSFLEGPNIIIIEWAEKLERYLPQGTVWVSFKHGKRKNERYITFN